MNTEVSFRDSRQAALVIRTLLRPAHLDYLWTEAGPTHRARQIFQQYGATLSAPEWLLVQIAFELWDGVRHINLGRIDTLDLEVTRVVCTLLIAIKEGPDAIDAWLDHEREQREREQAEQPEHEFVTTPRKNPDITWR